MCKKLEADKTTEEVNDILNASLIERHARYRRLTLRICSVIFQSPCGSACNVENKAVARSRSSMLLSTTASLTATAIAWRRIPTIGAFGATNAKSRFIRIVGELNNKLFYL